MQRNQIYAFGLLSRLVIALFLLTFPFSVLLAQAGLVVNEISQGSLGSREYAELVVVGTPCSTVDIRGWIIDDNNGVFSGCPTNPNDGALSGYGIAAGHVRFSFNPIWQNVPVGTIILLYSYDPLDASTQAEIGTLTPDFDDSNCDFVRVVPVNASNPFMEMEAAVPHAPGLSTSCPANRTCPNGGSGDPSYAPATYTPLNDQAFGGFNGKLGLRNGGDGFQTRDAGANFFHGISYGSPDGDCVASPVPLNGGPAGIHLPPSGNNKNYFFTNSISDDYNNVSNFTDGTASLQQTPGQPNSCENAQWIGSLRRPPESVFQNAGGGCDLTLAAPPTSICVGEQITLTVPPNTAGCSSDSYAWNFSGTGTISIIGNSGTSFTIEAVAPGTMNITLSAVLDNMLLYSQAGCAGPTFPESLDYNFPITIVSGPNAVPTIVNACNNGAGMGTFDLTSVQNIVNGGSGNTVNWFMNAGATIPILNPTNYTSGIGTVFATVSQGSCVSTPVPITLNLSPGPSANSAALTACDQGGGFSLFDLSSLNSTVDGGSGLVVNYWIDMAGTIPAIPANAYLSNTTTIYASVTDGICTSAIVPINLEVLLLPNPGNAFINVNPTSACGLATVTVTFNLPAGNSFDISLEYGNATSGYNTFTGSGFSTGSTAPFPITETTEFILTTVAYSEDPSCAITFSNPVVETVVINSGPDLLVSNSPTVCAGDVVDLSSLVTDQNSSGIPITFHGATPPTAGNELPSPVVMPVTNTTYYAFADGGAGCQSTAQIDLTVTTPATPMLGSTTICEDAFPISLIPLQDPAFPTGTWSGMGVTGTSFDPDGLSGPILLTFTSDAPCTFPAMTTITVNTQEAPMLLDAEICVTGGILDLTTLQDPNYPTGTWSGPGVIGSNFFPIGQSGPVGLNFTPDDPCALQGTAIVTVNAAPEVINISTDCDTDNLNYTVTFEINGGEPGTYIVDGIPITGNTFTSGLIPTGTPYSFSVDDENTCGPNIVSGVFDCQCVTFAGTMDLAAGPLNLCNGEAFSIAAFFNNDEILDGDDLHNFILHDNPGGTLGATFGTSLNGNFNFPGAVTLGQSYYISPVAGSDDGTGKIDFTDACLSVGQGLEVIFYEPTFTATVPAEICTGECYDWAITLNGFPDFTLDYDIVTPVGTFSESAVSSQNTLNITICPGILGVTSGLVELIPLNLEDLNCSNSLNNAPSYVTLVNTIPEIDLSTTLCAGESLQVNGTTYDAGNPSGTEILTDAAANGCDSIVNIDLTFFPEAVLNLDQTLCEGGSLVVNGTTYNESNPSGQEVLFGGSVNGCDSTININLSFTTAIVVDLSPVLCEGEVLVVNGTTYDAGNPVGTETFIGGSALGCDSVVNIQLNFFPPNIVEQNMTLCSGESLLVNGTTYDAANPTGTEILPGADQNGCDSTIHVALSFFPESVALLEQSLCEGSSVTVNGTIYDQSNPSGIEVLPAADVNGCDSTVQINLSFNTAVSSDLNLQLCPGESVVVNGTTYDSANPMGSEILIGGSNQGCDSIINVALMFFPEAVGNLNLELCEEESILVNGNIYDATNPSGTEILTGASFNGCDSALQVQLSFLPETQTDLVLTICPDESIIVNGTTYDAGNPNGTEVLPGANANGCDSIINVALTFFPETIGNLNLTLCEGESIIVNGTTYDVNMPSGTEVLTGAAANGCDSLLLVNVEFFPPAEGQLNLTLCEGESIIVNGTTYDLNMPSGTEVLAGAAANGCDSLLLVNVEFFPPAEGQLNLTLCEGESIIVNGTTYDVNMPSGTEVLTGASVNGCDSILQVMLNFESASFGSLEAMLCVGEFLVINGTTYNALNPSGQELFPGANAAGCDSTLSINLDFYPAAVGNLSITLPPDSSVVVNGTTYDIDNPSGVELISGGSFTGCDSTVVVDLNFEASIMLFAEGTGPACFGENDGVITIDTITGAKSPYSISIDGENFFDFSSFPIVWPNLESGFYDITIIDANDFMITIELLVPAPNDHQLNLGPDTLIQLGESISLQSAVNFFPEQVSWSPTDFLDCDSCLNVQLTPTETTLYTVVAVDSLGCAAVDQIQVLVQKDREIFIPNGFSPNNDGVNDKLIIFAGQDVLKVRRFQIFNRWGALVHNRLSFQPNDPTYGWDGFFNGQLLDPDVFVYYAEVLFIDGTIEIVKGDVVLLR